MKARYRLFQRGSVFYAEDATNGKQESLRTANRTEAARLLSARNEAHNQPALNLHIARAYLMGSDPQSATRTWHHVMEEIVKLKTGETKARWKYAIKDTALRSILNRIVISTTAEHFLRVLEAGTVSTNVYLRRIHNFSLDMSWLPAPVIPRRQWPKVEHADKRAITLEEHQRIVTREPNPQLRAFYQLCWHLGGSQSDVAGLHAEDIDWPDRTVAYRRHKTAVPVVFHFGEEVAALLKTLPGAGPLFPRLECMHERHRAKEFNRRCAGLGIKGVSLHSYRYSWAERAKTCGYPERFAQEALGTIQRRCIGRMRRRHTSRFRHWKITNENSPKR